MHGLWPNSLDPGFTDAISTSNEDPTCSAPFRYNLGWMSSDLIGRLNEVMPELNHNNFQAHEWNKHGVCYIKLLNDKVNKGKSKIPQTFAKKAYEKYWEEIISLYGQISSRFRLTKGSY